MRPSALLGAAVVAALLAWGFVTVVPESPGVYVLVLTAATLGGGVLYGAPTAALVDLPWRRCTRLRALAARAHTRWLARRLGEAGWTERVRRPIRSRSDVRALRHAAVASLLSHTVSSAFHLVATIALATAGHPLWGVVALATGALVHAWPVLLQVEVLGRVDELRAVVAARRG